MAKRDVEFSDFTWLSGFVAGITVSAIVVLILILAGVL